MKDNDFFVSKVTTLSILELKLFKQRPSTFEVARIIMNINSLIKLVRIF